MRWGLHAPGGGHGDCHCHFGRTAQSGCRSFVTTHYPEVKEYADKTQDILNARMTFDKETLKPTYQMVIGEAGESCAFYIADRLGMPSEMLKTAVRAAYGESAVKDYRFQKAENTVRKQEMHKIVKAKKAVSKTNLSELYHLGTV